MKEKMFLSGTFAELRDNHLHSGIDIKTGGVTGKDVYSSEQGYIARIAVSSGGFGKALYVVHPNGYTTVYAHLDHFRADIDKYVKNYQYENENFAVNIFLKADAFPVKKGDLIAYSGNSGSSGGPHLHFEIRESASEKPLNPLLFNLPVKDWVRPKIVRLCVFPFNNQSFINGKNKKQDFIPSGWGENYVLSQHDTILVHGKFYFGLGTYDLLNDSDSKNGIFSIDCIVDKDTVYSYSADGFLFSESRYVNSLIDYPTYINFNNRVYKTYVEPNNKLPMVKKTISNGIIELMDNNIHKVCFIVKDSYMNTSILTFYISKDSKKYEPILSKKYKYFFKYDEDNKIDFEGLILDIKSGSMFDNAGVIIDVVDKKIKNLCSKVYVINDKELTTFLPFSLYITINETVAKPLRNKVYVARLNNKDKWVYCGNDLSGENMVYAKVRDFGYYALFCDTVAPTIICNDLKTANNKLKVVIKDDETGIKSYYPKLNGKWLLMDYDAKNNMLIYDFDERLKKGENIFYLKVEDYCGNTSEITRTLDY